MNNNNKNNEAPILIPKDSYVEGYIKSIKSIRLECAFHGTILKKIKVIIDKASSVTVKGNVFSTMNEGSAVEGKIYASAFTSLTEKNFSKFDFRGLLNDTTTEVGLSKDILLSTIRETFYEHVFARKTNPDDLISYEFTQQKKIVKPKVKPILTNGENSTSTVKKSQLVK